MSKNINLWHYSKSNNFGDMLSPVVVNHMILNYSKKNYNLKFVKKHNENKLLAVGSILRKLTPNNIIWGSGSILNQEINTPKGCKFLAVRGPLTRNLIKNCEIPEIYGDPAILMSEIYKPKFINYTSKILLLPHYVDFEIMSTLNSTIRKINIKRMWTRIIDWINASDIIITSSLHGVIVAEAYGKNVIWIKSPTDKIIGGNFKFKDYFYSTRRKKIKSIDWKIIKNALENESNLFKYTIDNNINIDKDLLKKAWSDYYV